MKRTVITLVLLVLFSTSTLTIAGDGNRLTYLDELNPYYPHKNFPKLITPQWVGEEGVECVVVLAIDDMRDPKKYEEYLRPILIRLKQIDGRAPVSIMTCRIDPKHEQIQQWLAEGLSIEIHTVDHPCPLLQGGDFNKAKSTYDRCLDLMYQIPGNKPVAFRMPCCDSLNTVSPRFYAEIFNKTTGNGNYLQISSSVFNIYTSDDPEIPRELVLDADGNERFKKLIPKNLNRKGAVFNTFVNTIENYPYPYVIGNLCWEFPCVTPSDWSAQHYRGKNNPQTLTDFKAALDITVLKKGVFNLVFHPHGWILNDQIVELIDHAVKKHGNKVKFLTFKEALQRLNKNLLRGSSIRDSKGRDNGVRFIDLNNNGFLDVVLAGRKQKPEFFVWQESKHDWRAGKFPTRILIGDEAENDLPDTPEVRFGILHENSLPTVFKSFSFSTPNALDPKNHNLSRKRIASLFSRWHFDGKNWIEENGDGFDAARKRKPAVIVDGSRDGGVRFRDINHDGRDELIVSNPSIHAIFKLDEKQSFSSRLPFVLPWNTTIVKNDGKDAGLRFVDINEDGFDDIVFSNHERYGIWLFKDMQTGWSIEVLSGIRENKASGRRQPADSPNNQPVNSRKHQGADAPRSPGLPPIVRKDGSNNGFFVHSRQLFWQNEDTAQLTDLVDRRSFDDLLKTVKPAAKSPKMSLRSIEVKPDFTVELVAAEPLVMDPVAFEWGADGKLWVAEMADYPVGNENGGRVRFLEDTDNDGTYDKSTLFLDGLNFPNGVMPWKKGVLITAAPEILYAEDTNGDGKADLKIVLFTGFGQGNQQHRANGLAYGLDNWVYCANGDSNGRIKSTKTEAVTDISGRDFRINPETGELDPQSGRTQFGRNRDNWGNWFGCNNSNPHYHFVLGDHYLRRNPHTAFPNPMNHVSITPGAAPCYPVSKALARFNDYSKLNRFTSACSAIIYRDNLFGKEFAGNSFVSEPVHNLVHREIVSPKGVTFTSRRADDEQTSEFLASRDNWFRPTMLKTGPDGALYIADMYRLVIEHPQYIPKELQQGWDLHAGDDTGRIYRVFPTGTKLRPAPRLDKLSIVELVAALDSSSSWQRDTVQKLLVQRKDISVVLLLEKMIRENEHSLARLHALCTLDGLNALTPQIITQALNDPHSGVRRHAARLSEQMPGNAVFSKNRVSALFNVLLKLTDDPDPHVRMQLAYTLGEWDDKQTGSALGRIMLQGADDRFLTAAATSSVNESNVSAVLQRILNSAGNSVSQRRLVGRLLSLATRLGNEQSLLRVFSSLTITEDPRGLSQRFTVLAEVLDALSRRNKSLEILRNNADRELKAQLNRVPAVFHAARSIVKNETANGVDRVAAVRLLGRQAGRLSDDLNTLADLLIPQNSGALQSAAVERLGELGRADVPKVLLPRWKTFGPALRSQVLDVLLSRSMWAGEILDSIAVKRIALTEIDAARRERLLRHRDLAVRKLAGKLLKGAVNTDRRKVLDDYRTALTLTADPKRGKQVFAKFCSICHKINGAGHEVGPDLAALKEKSPESLLVAILDPNRNMESKYLNYIAVTTQGRSFNGLLANETGNSITLLAPEGKKQVILRSDLDELTSTAKSTMPEGLEKDIKPQDMANVMAYVASTGRQFRPNGRFPRTIRPKLDGAIELAADNCEIYGPTLKLEEKYNNLGYWGSERDRAIWPISVPRKGSYDVWINWACPEQTAGNSILFRCGTNRLTARVESTGNWETYREAKIGTIHLPEGSQRFEIRASRSLNGFLLDLKSVRLVPVPKK